MKKYYNVNYSLLALLLLPTFLRKEMITALVSSFVKPLEDLHSEFLSYVYSLDAHAYSQVCYMQALLNDEFDYNERRIKVRTAPIDFDCYLLWKENQDKPILISGEGSAGFAPYLLSTDGQTGSNNIDFEVVLPASFHLSTDEERRMKTLVNKHKLASKKYRIVYE